MKKYAPLATLVAVVLLGGGLLVANMLSNPANQTTAAAPAASVAAAPSEWAAAATPEPPLRPPRRRRPPSPRRPTPAARRATRSPSPSPSRTARPWPTPATARRSRRGSRARSTGDTLSLSGKTSSITATMDDKATFGMVTVDGKEWPFSAKGVASPAGLYEGRGNVDGVAARVGWIVEENGNVTGVESANGTREPAPPLDPADPGATTIDGSPSP